MAVATCDNENLNFYDSEVLDDFLYKKDAD